jgi:hypothetical protein
MRNGPQSQPAANRLSPGGQANTSGRSSSPRQNATLTLSSSVATAIDRRLPAASVVPVSTRKSPEASRADCSACRTCPPASRHGGAGLPKVTA